MERLTENDVKLGFVDSSTLPGYVSLYERLRKYEDAEEQGLLLRLPCKVGDTVYKLGYKPCHHGYDYPDSYGCCGCMDECDLERAIFERKADCLTFIINEFVLTTKNTVYFLTKEEAEKKLASMQKGK